MVASVLYLSTVMCYGHYVSQYMMVRKTRFNPPLQKTSFDQGGMETSFDRGGMTNEIQQVGISGMTHTRGIDNTLSVQVGSHKNHISVDQNNRSTEGYVMFLVTHFLEKV